ncbi:MAG: hypothetical protein AAF587_22750 [Bacteroidota bacterium]
MAAFEYAADIWETLITSSEIIRITARYEPLASEVLGSSRIIQYFHNFTPDPTEPTFQNGTWYPSALANKLAHQDLDSVASDIYIEFTHDSLLTPFGLSWYCQKGQEL